MPTHLLLEGRDQAGEPAFIKWERRVASANMRGVQLSGAKVFAREDSCGVFPRADPTLWGRQEQGCCSLEADSIP